MTDAIQAVRTRWEAFLGNLRERAQAIVEEAQPGCMAVFEQGGFDPFTMCNVLPAVRARLDELGRKAEDSWHPQVDGAFYKVGLHGREAVDLEYQKLRDFHGWMSVCFEGFEVRVKADASRILWARLATTLPTSLNCTQCASPIPIPENFLAVNLPCPSCRSINTFEPGQARILHTFAIPSFAHEEVWEELHALECRERPERLRQTPAYAKETEAWRRRYASR